ncbi:hypothetical protein [uncultured Limosilactobacillus sp.]|uniref:hypothetical protein n=1 Tax=uncultured Limosilactobacillus sp. TaxID=2837629 RepID=UPI0025D6ED3B|nr:hypothetical protein [uncultured Limosilactobacillus sp.]
MHHQFFGLFLDEWASLIAIGGGVGAGLALVMKYVLMPLKNSIDRLTEVIHNINDLTKEHSRRIERLEDRFEEHVGEAKVRNQKIKSLEHEVFDKGGSKR